MTPRQMPPDDPHLDATLALIRTAFAPMEGRVDPPSSIHRLTAAEMAAHTTRGELWAIGAPPTAVLIATPQGDALYLGKLAVAPPDRGRGLARALVNALATHAKGAGFSRLRLQTRIELIENHATFAALGFVETARTAHPGHATPTSITMERALP